MKRKYVVPESKLFAISMSENIAASGSTAEVSGAAVIKFTNTVDGCREIYTGDSTAPVKTTGTEFADYYNELVTYGASVYFNCFRFQI